MSIFLFKSGNLIFIIMSLAIVTFVVGCSGSSGSSDPSASASTNSGQSGSSTSSSGSSLIIDHSSTDLAKIPSESVEEAKKTLHIAYGHTSHGRQIIFGMKGLVSFKGALYDFNATGAGGALELRDKPFQGAEDLGNPDFTAWEKATRTYLDANPDINVVVWSWCRQLTDATEADVNTYLNLMSGLEKDYPDVKFVYMTGRLDGTGLDGNLQHRNDQIRKYCMDNGKTLYDFADIESYDPDGNYYGDKHPTDGCNYDYNNDGATSEAGTYTALPTNGDRNWAIDWQDSHIKDVDWYACTSEHSQPLNANQKTYAAWWLWARLAGWNGQ